MDYDLRADGEAGSRYDIAHDKRCPASHPIQEDDAYHLSKNTDYIVDTVD